MTKQQQIDTLQKQLDAWLNFNADDDRFKGNIFKRDTISYKRLEEFL